MSVGTLEEIIDDNHAIVSTSVGSEHYVSILSFVDKDQLEPGCSVLLNHKVTKTLTCFLYYPQKRYLDTDSDIEFPGIYELGQMPRINIWEHAQNP